MSSDGVVLTNLVKAFDSQVAISNVSLVMPRGKLTVLLGPSGCGKSTLLRMVAGFEQPTSGTISIDGQRIDYLPSSARNISMVFQSYALFPHMTVADNILFGLQVRKVAKQDQQNRLKEVADLMGLSPLLERKPAQLSGGQQQRVALARAVISERPVCLMDEPLSNLDAKLRHEMRVEIRKIQQEFGLTMIYVTHDQVEAITMADQIVLLNKGQVEQVAKPRDIYNSPASMFAAKFIGAPPMNLIPAGALLAHLDKGHMLDLPADAICGIRPEDIEVSSASGIIKAELQDIEYQGADQLLGCRLGEHLIYVRMPSSKFVDVSGQVFLTWNTRALHLFDSSHGHRIEDQSSNRLASNAESAKSVSQTHVATHDSQLTTPNI